eukprot:COSAG05_NODE_3464_length_2044_cov_1.932648_3_plen_103_part_00
MGGGGGGNNGGANCSADNRCSWLFDLATDDDERINLFEANPDIVSAFSWNSPKLTVFFYTFRGFSPRHDGTWYRETLTLLDLLVLMVPEEKSSPAMHDACVD